MKAEAGCCPTGSIQAPGCTGNYSVKPTWLTMEYPLVNLQLAIEHGNLQLMYHDLPIKKLLLFIEFHCYMLVY